MTICYQLVATISTVMTVHSVGVVVYVFIAHKIFLVSEDLNSKLQILSIFGYGFVLHACQDPSRPLLFALCTTPSGRTAEELVNLAEYLTNTIDSVRDRYPDCRIMLLGDFNNFISRSLSLKQIVCSPTRGLATLDLIITDLHNFYDKPRILAPLGSADHSIVQLVHNNVDKQNPKPIKRLVRRYSRPATIAFGHWASTYQWFEDLGPNPSVDDLANSFSSCVSSALDVFFL